MRISMVLFGPWAQKTSTPRLKQLATQTGGQLSGCAKTQ
jgi:hypothetical protein